LDVAAATLKRVQSAYSHYKDSLEKHNRSVFVFTKHNLLCIARTADYKGVPGTLYRHDMYDIFLDNQQEMDIMAQLSKSLPQ